jgi:hypothetical protein
MSSAIASKYEASAVKASACPSACRRLRTSPSAIRSAGSASGGSGGASAGARRSSSSSTGAAAGRASRTVSARAIVAFTGAYSTRGSHSISTGICAA